MFGIPVSTVLSLVLGIINFARQVTTYMHDNKMISLGQAQAVAEAMTQASAQVALATKAADEADAKAGGDPARVDPAIFEDGK